jgi:molybdenum cofactor biosynthesis enzyme MoaA
MSAPDLVWACGAASTAGFTKFKLTGGEPTLRADILQIVTGLRQAGIEDASMVTNGTTLTRLAGPLRSAGLSRLNVSLRTLNQIKFASEHGPARLLQATVQGIDAAIGAGFGDLKINFVLRGADDWADFLSISAFAAARDLTVVLLPVMPTGSSEEEVSLRLAWTMVTEAGVSAERDQVDAEGIRRKLVTLRRGGRVLLRVDELRDRAPYSACGTCNRRAECREGIFPVRLSSDGILRPCLAGGLPGVDVRRAIVSRDHAGFVGTLNGLAGAGVMEAAA